MTPRTGLSEPHVEDLVHLRVVCGDVKDVVGLVLDARYVHRDEVLRNLLPPNSARAARAHVEHLGPQPTRHQLEIN